ncbi:hypothetical protein [Achromobacter xylosoxidans]|uniref:hypothetical protein n=1 Tax=Alcaligenes xylosoxydans xylosoxydans TaxID=85698 RepID=UPI00165D7C0C|nr:hypothetical protein [Achromobacter xylosoxidans]
MSECKGIAGMVLGHSFQAVYEVKPSGESLRTLLGDGMELKGAGAEEIVRRMAEGTVARSYLGHVCSRCGLRIEK